jgi:hypothetical protein
MRFATHTPGGRVNPHLGIHTNLLAMAKNPDNVGNQSMVRRNAAKRTLVKVAPTNRAALVKVAPDA